MRSTRVEGVAVSPGPGGAPSGGGENRRRSGVQEWPDGSGYEGELVNGLKHGRGRYTWSNGECYEGSFHKDYRHGDGTYSWPSGLTFTGKFYLNRREGWGRQAFPDGATFRGLYHADQRFGPGVITYPDGCDDVGLWLGERLLKLCAPVEDWFSLKNFPDYAAYMDPVATTNDPTQVDADRDLPSDDDFVLPPGIERYSTDGDHLPLPPGRRRELDRRFYGESWEPESDPYQGYERDPLSKLPLQARLRAHIEKYRLQADGVVSDVAALLSLNRDGFGPRGPLEVASESLIQHAARGELQAVARILQTGSVHPDVADSRGHTALIAATVNGHNPVIQLLLDMAADIDKLNCEGMSALAVCHVLCYPFQSLQTTFTESPAETQISQPNFTTTRLDDRPPTAKATLSSETSQSDLADQTTEKRRKPIPHQNSEVPRDRKLITESWPGPSDSEHLQEEERKGEEVKGDHKETERQGQIGETEEKSWREEEEESKGEDRGSESRRDRTREGEINGGEFKKMENKEDDVELGERRETESRKENTVEDMEKGVGHLDEGDATEKGTEEGAAGVERYIQVVDGHVALGSVRWRDRRAKAAAAAQQSEDKDLNPEPTFDSACSLGSYGIQVTEEMMQRSAEALSRTGAPLCPDTQETVRKMAALKIERRVRLSTLRLLLERGADPNVSKVPMPVLFLAIMAADVEAVRRLLLSGARTDVPLAPERKGLYPLHVAAALPGPAGPSITELLLHAITDPDARAFDHDEIYAPDKLSKAREPLSTNESPDLREGGRTALHVACQRDGDYQNASKVVALLLSHSANTDLLWSGHSPLSLAIAAGNDLAVAELLNGGANPSIPLGRKVGSALCAVANINYHRAGGNRAKLLEALALAGADIQMPVAVGDLVGTAVDFAHYSFNQDSRMVNTPFHALSLRERETFKARRRLLSMMGDLLRQTAGRRERENSAGSGSTERFVCTGTGAMSSNAALASRESLPPPTGRHRRPALKFCYQCGRSQSGRLTACSRCCRVFFCSRTCKLEAWDQRHKEECVRVSASADGVQRTFVFKSQSVPEPLSLAEMVLERGVNLQENYSSN